MTTEQGADGLCFMLTVKKKKTKHKYDVTEKKGRSSLVPFRLAINFQLRKIGVYF